jgi:hypothetical protein
MLMNGGDQDDSPEAGSEGMLGHFSATRSWPPWITPMSRACSTAAARKTPSKCFDALQAPPGESVHRLPCARESAVSIRSQHRRRENLFYANSFGIKSLPGHLRGILVCGRQATASCRRVFRWISRFSRVRCQRPTPAPAARYRSPPPPVSDGRQPDDDGRRPEAAFLQGYSPSAHRGLGKTLPRFLCVPAEEFIQGHVVDPFGYRRRDGVEHEGLHQLPFVRFVYYG